MRHNSHAALHQGILRCTSASFEYEIHRTAHGIRDAIAFFAGASLPPAMSVSPAAKGEGASISCPPVHRMLLRPRPCIRAWARAKPSYQKQAASECWGNGHASWVDPSLKAYRPCQNGLRYGSIAVYRGRNPTVQCSCLRTYIMVRTIIH